MCSSINAVNRSGRSKKYIQPFCYIIIKMKLTLALLLLCMASAYGLNILGVFSYQGRSHFFVFRSLLKELADRGHNVTVVTYFPEEKPNYHEVILNTEGLVLEGAMNTSSYFYIDLLMVASLFPYFGTTNCEDLLKNEQVMRLTSQKFDVLLTEKFCTDCAHGLAYKLGAPVVGLTSHVPMPFHYDSTGIPYNPAYVPYMFLGGGTKPTLYERIERVVVAAVFKTVYAYTTYQNDQTIAKYLGDDVPPLSELARQMKFMLLYSHFILTGPRAYPTNVIEVGGYHTQKPKALPKDLQEFLDSAEHGVIYISFGSVVSTSSIPSERKQAILDTMAALPQKFIWKWNDDSMNIDKSKIIVGKWLPQYEILSHPNTVAFLSHAGMLGTVEAIHTGVPVVAMPVFGDQPSNAAAIEESGLGVQLSHSDLTKENLLNAFKKVLDPGFRTRVKLLSKAWHDRPLSPMDTAVYWVEYAARYPELNFTSPAAFVPLYQEQNWDIIAVFAVILAINIVVIRKLISLCLKPKTKQAKRKIN